VNVQNVILGLFDSATDPVSYPNNALCRTPVYSMPSITSLIIIMSGKKYGLVESGNC